MESGRRFRLVTRSDFDGLVCAVLLKELDLIDEILFVHPKDMQDGKIPITERDITTNLPYVATAYMAFDHHHSETLRNVNKLPNHIIKAEAPSAARVVYDYYGGVGYYGGGGYNHCCGSGYGMYNTVPIVRTDQEQVVVVRVDMFDAQSGQPVWSASAETGSQGSLSERGDALRQAVQKAMTAYPPS